LWPLPATASSCATQLCFFSGGRGGGGDCSAQHKVCAEGRPFRAASMVAASAVSGHVDRIAEPVGVDPLASGALMLQIVGGAPDTKVGDPLKKKQMSPGHFCISVSLFVCRVPPRSRHQSWFCVPDSVTTLGSHIADPGDQHYLVTARRCCVARPISSFNRVRSVSPLVTC
jgi:hypothetical protein